MWNVESVLPSTQTSKIKHTPIQLCYKLLNAGPSGSAVQAYVCGRWPADIVGSHPAEGTDICRL
jgi:hypothetical protein